MTTPDYNLNEDVSEYFRFQLGGHWYQMRYPTSEEMEDRPKVKKQEDGTYDDEALKASVDFLYKFIKPEGEGPDIATALKKSSVKVVANFNKMFMTEFGLG